MCRVIRPAVRQMDNYGSDVQDAFKKAEDAFFASGKPYRKDEVISLVSANGYFKVDIYEYTPVDIHYVVFFFNKKTSMPQEKPRYLSAMALLHAVISSGIETFPMSAIFLLIMTGV